MLQGEHSAILLTFIKIPFVIKIFDLSIFEWPLYTGFTVYFLSRKCLSSRECSGSVVESLARDREIAGSSLTGVNVSLSKKHKSLLRTGSPQEDLS